MALRLRPLKTTSGKAEIDRKVAEEAAREEFAAALQARREAAQWRCLRGEEEEGDDELLRGPQEVARDEWMTKLPPERQAGGPPAQHNTFFRKSEKSGRGDTSVWTDTPAAKAEKEKMQYLEAYKQAALTNGPADELEEREKERAAKEAQLMDSYNSRKRGQSLMEEHKAERAAGGKKKSKNKAEKSVGASRASEKDPDWKVNHPWKPWDREKDIAVGRKSVNLDPKNFKEGLSSRFGGFTDNEPRKVVLSLIAFAIMAANKQTLYDAYYSDVYYTGVYYYIKFSSVKSFVGVLALNCIVCFYAAVHLVHTLVTLSSKRSSATTGFAILTFVFDTVLAYALMGASAAGADSAMYLRDEGCGSFEKFCQRAEASVALSFLAFAVMAASAALYPVRLLKLMKG